MKSKTGEEYKGSECQQKIGELIEDFLKKDNAIKDDSKDYPHGKDCCSPSSMERHKLHRELGRRQREILEQYGFR